MTARTAPAYRRRPRLRVIEGQAGGRRRLTPWITFTTLVVVAFFALIFSRTALDRSAFELQEVQSRIFEEQARYERLRLDVARLESPTRIEPLAREMGLVFPGDVISLTAPGVIEDLDDPEQRWAELKSILTASP